MTKKELYRTRFILELSTGQYTTKQVAEQLGMSTRQVRRLRRRVELEGPSGLAHKSRSRPSGRALCPILKEKMIKLLRERYHDFGPTFAAEKLTIDLNNPISRETVRKIQIEIGLRKSKRSKERSYHPRRPRRSCIGELIQIDGSIHDWLEGRGPRMVLIAFIDDATSRVMHARFVEAEDTETYTRMLLEYSKMHGLPQALYSDKHSIFRQTKAHIRDQGRLTILGENLERLGIELICANSPQAKGRVERHFGTQQDRLVKEMRLAGVCTMEEANKFLTTYIPIHNKKFSVEAKNCENGHVMSQEELKEEDFYTEKETRKLSKGLSFQYKNKEYQLINPSSIRRLQHRKIEILHLLNGELRVRLEDGKFLMFEEVRVWSASKQRTLDGKTTALVELGSKGRRPNKHHPWR